MRRLQRLMMMMLMMMHAEDDEDEEDIDDRIIELLVAYRNKDEVGFQNTFSLLYSWTFYWWIVLKICS